MQPQPASHQRNAFGFLRLLFASLVIVAHVPEQIDGDRSRELLTKITGITFGDLAVDGFFLVSGYLIARSFIVSATSLDYFVKRVLRIYPAFCVAFLVSILAVALAPGGGIDLGDLSPGKWVHLLLDMIRLKPPELPGSYPTLHQFSLDAPTWTIGFEFRCYILAAIWGWLGLYRRRWLFALLTFALLVAHIGYRAGYSYPIASIPGMGETFRMVRLAGMFMVGTCFYLFRDRIRLDGRGAIVAAILLGLGFAWYPLNELGVALCGGYLTFWFAIAAPAWLKRLNAREDVSYGYYLYAWPAAQLLILHFGKPALVPTILADFGLAALAGTISWFAVERWFARLKPRRVAPAADQASNAAA